MGMHSAICRVSKVSGIMLALTMCVVHYAAATDAPNAWYPGEQQIAEPSGIRYRSGVTASGYPYNIFPDGSGSVTPPSSKIGLKGWSVDCSKDAMTDQRACIITSYENRLLVSYRGTSAPVAICVVGHDFPGYTAAIRVDNNPPIATDEDGCVSAKSLYGQLLQGGTVITRRVEWPFDYPKDETGPLLGWKRRCTSPHTFERTSKIDLSRLVLLGAWGGQHGNFRWTFRSRHAGRRGQTGAPARWRID